MITLQAIGVEYSAKPLFSGVSAVINPSDRIALVGKNGAGKSTLLKIIAGLQTATTGQVAASDGTTIGYLPQQMKISDETSIIEEVRKVFASQLALEQESERLSLELASREDYDSEEYHKLIDRLTLVNERIEMEKSSNMEAEIERTLIGLGFNREDFPRPTAELSGGWRMRIELAKLLLRRPDVLLLDEPTNHLTSSLFSGLSSFLWRKRRLSLWSVTTVRLLIK